VKNHKQRLRYVLLSSATVLVVLLGVIVGVTVFHAQTGAQAAGLDNHTTGSAIDDQLTEVTPMHPMYEMAVTMAGQANQAQVACLASPKPPLCYSPQQLRQAYGIAPLLQAGVTGKGRIITIIDAFQAPTIRGDLHLFDQLFGLKDAQLNIMAPFGLTPFNAQDPIHKGFAGEITLDVEWAHAIAPDATINLVLANPKNKTIQGQLTALLQATNFAVTHNIGSVISQSFGTSEVCLGTKFLQAAHEIFRKARAQQQTVFASAGDSGAGTIQCNANGKPVTLAQGVNYPASDPLVTSVGGTTLLATKAGNYLREVAWNESAKGAGATGGGISKVFALPNFQQNIVKSKMRGASDIALVADPLTGVPIVTSSLMPGKTVVIPIGGTSVGAPVAAGMTALLDQAMGMRTGFLNTAFYRLLPNAAYAQAFHDIRTGNNTFVFQAQDRRIVTVPGFKTAPGWDAPTGLGTPNVANLAKFLPKLIKANDGATL